MKTKLTILLVLALALATVASAREVVTVTPLTDTQIRSLGGMEPAAAGLEVGNLNDPYYALGGWFWGDESYAYIFTADQLACDTGFQLAQVHMLAQFDATMVPVTFQMSVSLNEADDDGTGCYLPGAELCASQVYNITIETAGMYDLAIPISCECAYIADPAGNPYVYALEAHFYGLFDMDLISDNLPTACTAYNDWGSGWYDLFTSYYEAGNIIMWGDVTCCADPVANEDKTWSEIKQMFK